MSIDHSYTLIEILVYDATIDENTYLYSINYTTKQQQRLSDEVLHHLSVRQPSVPYATQAYVKFIYIWAE